MEYEERVAVATELRNNWAEWDDVDRGEAILDLREAGVSLRKLGRLVGCSEGLIRCNPPAGTHLFSARV